VFLIAAAGVRDYELIIYNTYGEIIYRSNDMNATWDGSYRGRPCANGVYPYRIVYSGKRQGARQMSGVILVGR
jgi:gliding motility-associated-like protein